MSAVSSRAFRISRLHDADPKGLQNWGRLVRFIATEDGKEHIGEPVDATIDGERVC